MAIEKNVMISKSFPGEYGVLIQYTNGVTELLYLDKEHGKLPERIRSILNIKTSPFSGDSVYFVESVDPKYTPDMDVSIVTVYPHLSEKDAKVTNVWKSTTWIEAYLDITMALQGAHGYNARKINNATRNPLCSFVSFVEFCRRAYPIDSYTWSQLDPNFNFAKKQFQLPLTA